MLSLPISVGALYVRKYFNEESKKAAIDLVTNIREEYVKILQEVSWMDDVTRMEAIEKAKSMTSHIAFPDELIDNNKLEEFYKGLELKPDSLLQNVLRVRTFNDKNAIQRLRKPVNKTDWESHTMPTTVNAAYSPLENSIRKVFSMPLCCENSDFIEFLYIKWIACFQQSYLPPFCRTVSFQLIGKFDYDDDVLN